MTTSDTFFWREIEKIVGLPLPKAIRMRWNKRYPGRLIDLRSRIETYVEEFNAEGKHDAIWEVMRLLDNGDWPPNQSLPEESWDEPRGVGPVAKALLPEPLGFTGDPLVEQLPPLIQVLVEERLERTSICVDYAIAGAITQLAAIAGNRVRFRAWGDVRLPNVYVVLVGQSARSYKSSVLRRIQETLTAIDPKLLAAEGVSPEGLLMDLVDSPSRLWIRDEFSGLISAIRQRDYMRPAHDMLLELFDRSQSVYQKRLATKQYATREAPALSFFGTIQPEVMGEELFSGRNVDSGFVNRLLLVCGEGMPRRWPALTDYQARREALRGYMRGMLRESNTVVEAEHLEGPAACWEGVEREEFGRYGEYVALRSKVQALKLATLFQIADGWPYGKRVEDRWLTAALTLLHRWYTKGAEIIGVHFILDDGERDRRKYYVAACHATHNKTGPLSLSQLQVERQISSRKSDEYQRDLVERGWISVDDDYRVICTKASLLCEAR